MRFLWGLRIALPLAMGMTRMDARRFFWLNLVSAAVWAALFSFLGYSTSKLFEHLVDDLRRYELWIAAGLLTLAAIVLAFRWRNSQIPKATP
jgi:membrane protein DedA with SNARE-associated domain